MINRKLSLSMLVAVFLVQLYVPASMIAEREEILNTGKAYKFKTAPVDPNDPFRGKYIALQFAENEFFAGPKQAWQYNEPVYVHLSADAEGYATIQGVSREAPGEDTTYIKAAIDHALDNGLIGIAYPFDRYYLEESKAYEAEESYRASLPNTTQTTYALVMIKAGDAVLKDVMIGDVSIKEVVEKNRREQDSP